MGTWKDGDNAREVPERSDSLEKHCQFSSFFRFFSRVLRRDADGAVRVMGCTHKILEQRESLKELPLLA